MTQPRFAFAAAYWGNHAVVCRAVENCPGPVVDQEFGEFDTWTEASSFADKLNEGLDLTSDDTRQIVTSAILSASCVLRAATAVDTVWKRAPVLVAAERLCWQSIQARLDLALTFCRLANSWPGLSPAPRILSHIGTAMDHALELAFQKQRDQRELKTVCSKLRALEHWHKRILRG